MRKIVIFAFTLVWLLSALVPAESASDKPKRGGTLTMAIRKDLSLMNPMVRTSSTDKSIRDLVFESLVGIDLKGNIQPNLAESWEISRDGKLYTFNLRKGVKFHNGQEMTAEDAKFAMEFTMNPKNGAYGYSRFTLVERVDAPDKHTLKITLKKSSPAFLAALSSIQSVSVIPKGSLQEGVDKPSNYPPGTGPFRFVEWKSRQQIVFERNENYWGHKPFVDRLILRPIPDETVRMTALRAGDIDLVEVAPYAWVKQIVEGKLKGIVYAEAEHAGFRVLKFNVSAPPFNNKKLRQAVAHALDRKEILQATYSGFGQPADQRYPKGHLWYFDGVRPPPYDLEKAKTLLKEAGYKGEPIELMLRQGEQEIEAVTIQAQLKKIGMNVKLSVFEYGTYTYHQRSGEFAFLPSGGDYHSDPMLTYGPEYLCVADAKKRAENDTGYCDKEMNALIQRAETELDPEKRREIVRQIVQKGAEDLPEIAIGFVPRFFAFRDHVKGFSTDSEGAFRWFRGGLNYTWLDK